MPSFSNFSRTLIHWYSENKRDLPWRNTRDPYAIWISEIILQQTRVQQGLSYYHKFMDRFPDVSTMADASEQEILNLWQGLGYYSRARNMHKSARIIAYEYKGVFPRSYEEVLALKGVGEYTAAAITSFAYGSPNPVIDGNVIRVICRLFGIEDEIQLPSTKALIKERLTEVFDKEQADTFNQAIMEFGALQCTPKNPDCKACPFSDSCLAFNLGKIKEIPFKKKAAAKKDRYFHYAVIRHKGALILRKRDERDIWKNMYDFPISEVPSNEDFGQEDVHNILKDSLVKYKIQGQSEWKKHILSHQRIHAQFHEIEVLDGEIDLKDDWRKVYDNELEDYPLPKLIDSYINGL